MNDIRFHGERRPGAYQPVKVIAVTGGAGFLGSYLCEALATQGHHVVCIDNLNTGRKSNIEQLLSSERFRLVNHDVTLPFPNDLPRFDEIYNLACPASPIYYQSDPVKTALTCAQGSLHSLQQAAHDNARFFHASTSEIYGDPQVHPQSEDYFGNVNPIGPRSCYDEGKRFAEMLVTDYGRKAGLAVKIVRIFNTYGPRMRPDDGRVVSNFVVQALRGDPITVYGDGRQTRSFCYVDDLIDGMMRLMRSGEEVVGPVNIGNPVETTVRELAEIIVAMTGSASKIVYRDLPMDDPYRRLPDITKAVKHLSWTPKIALRDGLARTISYFAHLEREVPESAIYEPGLVNA